MSSSSLCSLLNTSGPGLVFLGGSLAGTFGAGTSGTVGGVSDKILGGRCGSSSLELSEYVDGGSGSSGWMKSTGGGTSVVIDSLEGGGGNGGGFIILGGGGGCRDSPTSRQCRVL